MTGPYGVVFLPIPEELEPEVMRLVTSLILSSSLRPWDGPSMTSLLEALDDEQRAVLLHVAQVRAEESRFVTEVETAEAAGLSVREVRAVLREFEELGGDRNRAVLVMQRPGEDPPAGGGRELFISMPFAKLVLRGAGATA